VQGVVKGNRGDGGLLDEKLIDGVAHGQAVGEGEKRGTEMLDKCLNVDWAENVEIADASQAGESRLKGRTVDTKLSALQVQISDLKEH
jgi:hypothetical protein